MKYMLDTNICIYISRHQPQSVLEKFKSIAPGEIGISSITYSELMYGVYRSQHQEKNRNILVRLAESLDVIPYDLPAAEHYGEIRSTLEKQGQLIGSLDMLIVAHARSLSLTLVTNNAHEFKRVENLQLENWV